MHQTFNRCEGEVKLFFTSIANNNNSRDYLTENFLFYRNAAVCFVPKRQQILLLTNTEQTLPEINCVINISPADNNEGGAKIIYPRLKVINEEVFILSGLYQTSNQNYYLHGQFNGTIPEGYHYYVDDMDKIIL